MAGPGRPRYAATAVTMAVAVPVLAGCSGAPAAASSPSLARLRPGERRLTEANKPAERAVAILRSQLGPPPPETS